MRGVVAVLHEHPAPVAELHGQRHGPARVQPVDVLPAALCQRHVGQAAVSSQDLAFLEMDVNRVVPPAAIVDQVPDFSRPESRRGREPAVIRGQLDPTVGTDAPRA